MKEENKLGKIGAILNILFCLISLTIYILFIIMEAILGTYWSSGDFYIGFNIFGLIIFMVICVGTITTIVFSVIYLKNQKYKTTTGVLGILFNFWYIIGMIGGIFILYSSKKEKDKKH